MDQPTLSLVLPAHNEARNIVAIAARLAEICKPFGKFELVFVDDGSTDDTLAVIRSLAARDPAVRFVSFTRNFGHQAALRAGLRHARGTAVIVMDCDFEHPPETVLSLIAEWQRGAKIVVTRRLDSSGGASAVKRMSSRMFYRILNALGDVSIPAGSADFMLLDRAAVDVVNALEDQDVFMRGLVRWIGFPMATVSYVQGTRQSGDSKYTLRRMVDFAITGIVAHSVRPLRLAIHLALSFAGVGILLLLYSIVSFFWIHRTVTGWTSIMAVIAILGSGQFLVLGIIGEYIGRILRETRHRPVYIVAATEADDAQPSAASRESLGLPVQSHGILAQDSSMPRTRSQRQYR